MKLFARALACLVLAAGPSALGAQSIPELFGQAKAQIKTESWKDALKTLDALDAESQKPGNEGVRNQLSGPLAFYRGVCDANLGQSDEAVERFGAFLSVQPNASIDPKVYSKKAVAAFEKAQKAAANHAPSLAEAYKTFQPPAASADRDPGDRFWGDGAVHWIMTAEEAAAWPTLPDGNARADFIEKFWAARQAVPGADGRTYRQEFERRIAFADAYLAEDEEQPGSLTDRGMVFVLLGPPTYAGRRPMRTGDDKNDAAGLSTVGSHDASVAENETWARVQSRPNNPGRAPSSAQLATSSVPLGGPGKNAAASGDDKVEVWHYRRELLPKAVPYQQVDFQFLTKKGYGANALQREPDTSNTLEAARGAARPGR